MQDKDLERKIKATREAIAQSELTEEHKEALHESLDQAAKCANGSTEKLHDLTVAFCKSTLRTARSDISFKARVADAVQDPLDKLREEIVQRVSDLLAKHTMDCPMRAPEARATTWKDIAMVAAKNKWFYVAVSVIAFSPNLVSVVELFTKK